MIFPKPYNHAINWLHRHSGKGAFVSDKCQKEYPEVTGYFIPTLLEWGEHDLARKYALYLVETQNEDGSWSDPIRGEPYAFDTGQCLRGLVAIYPRMPAIYGAIDKAAHCLESHTDFHTGQLSAYDESIWTADMSRRIHMFCAKPLMDTAVITGDTTYGAAANHLFEFHSKDPEPGLSHFAMYCLEAEIEFSPAWMSHNLAIPWSIRRDGAVPAHNPDKMPRFAFKRAGWSCLPGQFQYAKCAYMAGLIKQGRAALDWGLQFQNQSGGFYGCSPWGNYFEGEEVSWTVKYFLDAYQWMMKREFASHAKQDIAQYDGRLLALKQEIPKHCLSLLDAGCGKGRYLLRVNADLKIGLDISPENVRATPYAYEMSLLNITLNRMFDCVYCIEALEHSIRPEVAIKEMCDHLEPGGKIIIIDKCDEFLGKMILAPWEQWFNSEKVCEMLEKHCKDVTVKEIGYEDKKPDGMFLMWTGVKR